MSPNHAQAAENDRNTEVCHGARDWTAGEKNRHESFENGAD